MGTWHYTQKFMIMVSDGARYISTLTMSLAEQNDEGV